MTAELMNEFNFKNGSIQIWNFNDSFVVAYHFVVLYHDICDFAVHYIMKACYMWNYNS